MSALIRSLSAVTLATHDMARAVAFYQALGFVLRYGDARFSSFVAGASYLNLIAAEREQRWSWWGRVIFHVDDVDAMYRRALHRGRHRPRARKGVSRVGRGPVSRTVRPWRLGILAAC
jgi:catechol 2,3-dioxygenase-like lactoylglutathione lyase family enzyme